jgi:hypothetical protein
MVELVGWDFDMNAEMLLNAATAYCIVKAAMPIRIAGSLMLTPALARLLQRSNPFAKSK